MKIKKCNLCPIRDSSLKTDDTRTARILPQRGWEDRSLIPLSIPISPNDIHSTQVICFLRLRPAGTLQVHPLLQEMETPFVNGTQRENCPCRPPSFPPFMFIRGRRQKRW
ncbi:hypothetical protein CDAR_619361 [Caerostris darwini]|uniref:Uncharacterized protein n=1 Tax=Caerostris darwini TaxID=1538125 RepID=A0AAV4PTY8_9ARAC|nr:hypothetical protein CDAR_619361 [Caerostris darwini]